jgi:hypothetical protein
MGLTKRYGASLAHLVLMLFCFAVAIYAFSRAWKQGGVDHIVFYFVVLLILHDLVGWPLYTSADRAMQRVSRGPKPWINYVRIPFFISGVLLIVAFPLIFRLSASAYAANSGLSESPYLYHWLLVTGALFTGSGFVYLFRARGVGRRARSRSGA